MVKQPQNPSTDNEDYKGLRIIAVITAMDCGGAERQMASLVNWLASKGHWIQLMLLHGGPIFFKIDNRVKIQSFVQAGNLIYTKIGRFLGRTNWIKKAVLDFQPHVIISFIEITNILTLFACKSTGVPVIVSERTYPPMHKIGKIYSLMRRWLYPKAARLVVQTNEAACWAEELVDQRCVRILANPVAIPSFEEFPEETVNLPSGPIIAAVGRLDPIKGFHLLIRALAKLKQTFPHWKTVILGDGPQREELEDLIIKEGLGEQVRLLGTVKNPSRVLRQCELFVLPSLFEGFPNALCEAMACGLPAVSFSCPVGPQNIIRDGVDGLLVSSGNIEALSDALSEMMASDIKRAAMATKALDIVDRFPSERINLEWEKMIWEVKKS